MSKKVIKRDGRKEDFIPEKIVVSAVKSNADPSEARKIAIYIEGKIGDKIETKKIKEMVLERLAKEHPECKDNWLLFDRAVKKRKD